MDLLACGLVSLCFLQFWNLNSLSANIITRGRRSLGYGFVEFASEADAEKAVAAMNKKEIAGRPINVEVARPRDPAKEAEVREKKAARVAKPKKEGEADVEGEASSPATGARGNGRRRPGGRRGGRKPADGAATSSSAPVDGAAPSTEANGTRGARRNITAATSTGGAAPAGGARRPRAPKRAAETRPASDTTLFVANVPFTTDDEQLRTFFAEFNPKSAHVVRMRNNRSRGYGFVEFEDKAGQTAGLAVDGKEVPLPNGTSMKLSVKVAMTPPVPSTSEAPAAEQ